MILGRVFVHEPAQVCPRSRGTQRALVVQAQRGAKAKCSRIPCRKLDGELVFVVGEVRQWLLDNEETVVAGRSVPLVVPMKRQA